MSKRPSLSAETVVRKSRLAAKGEAVPALVHGQHSHSDHPDIGASAALPSAAPQSVPSPAPAAEVVAQPVIAQSVVDGLLAAMAERDRQLEQARAELLKLEQERAREREQTAAKLAQLEQERGAAVQAHEQIAALLQQTEQERGQERNEIAQERSEIAQERSAIAQERSAIIQERSTVAEELSAAAQARAAATKDHDQMAANLAAADATIDELRNRFSDLRSQLDHSRAEVSRLVEQHAGERQTLLDHHKAECERLMALAARPAVAAEPPPPVADSGGSATAFEGGVLESAKRWLFGNPPEAAAKPASPVNQKSVASQQKPSAYQPRSAAVQSAGPGPGVAKPSVIKPVGPPTAPKVLNRRPLG